MNKQFLNTCLPSIIAYAASELSGKPVDVNMVAFTLGYKFNIGDIYADGVPVPYTQKAVEYYFVTKDYESEYRSLDAYKGMIDKGRPIITGTFNEATKSLHAVMIIGYNLSGNTLLYMDPMQGKVMRGSYNLFFYDINFPLIKTKK